LKVRDLAASDHFYREILGFVNVSLVGVQCQRVCKGQRLLTPLLTRSKSSR
jgi:catechol 2,3-dioxygenase-like lactoylglutathione lyase family enzyme